MNNSNSMPCTKSAAAQIENPVMKQMTSWLIEGEGCPHIPFGNRFDRGRRPAGQGLRRHGDRATAIAKEMQAAVKNARG